jgi:hypothetical protein
VALDGAHSGLVIEAAEGERPVLCGGVRVPRWHDDGDGLVAADLAGTADGSWDFRTLVVNGEFRPRARLPEEGVFTHESVFDVRWMSTTGGGWERKPTEEELTTLRYRAGDLGTWLDPRNAEITVYHQWDESLVGVLSLDEDTRTVRFMGPAGHPPGAFAAWNEKGRTYVVWNVREGMTRPGQWYLDRRRGKLVYWPMPGEKMEHVTVIAPRTNTILALRGLAGAPVKDVTVSGIALAASGAPLGAMGFGAGRLPGAIEITGPARSLAFSDLEIHHVGGYGVVVRRDRDAPAERITIRGCSVSDTGGGGMILRADRVTVEETEIRRCGFTHPSGIGLTVSGKDTVIRHNEISDVPYSALTSSVGPATIEANRFERFMQRLDDGAAIYVTFCHGMVIRGNVALGTSGRLAHAYYLDEQTEDSLVEGNLAVDTRWPSHNHMARRNTLRGNVFVDHEPSVITLMKCEDFTLERNVWWSTSDLLVRGYEAISRQTDNVFFSTAGKVEVEQLNGYEGSGRAKLDGSPGTRLEDPGLRDPEAGDYGLREGGLADRLGIGPVDPAAAGLSGKRREGSGSG